LRVFGSTVHVLDKDKGKDKFDAKTNRDVFVGYPRESKGYRVWIPELRKTVLEMYSFSNGMLQTSPMMKIVYCFKRPDQI